MNAGVYPLMGNLHGKGFAGTMVAACLACCLTGCRIFPEWETIVVSIPPLPPAWSDCGLEPEWEARAFWPGGECPAAIRPDGTVELLLPRGESVAVLGIPSVAGRALRPAGVVLPTASARCGRTGLTWEGGYRAAAARALIRAGVDPACFDLDRFQTEALARLEDPWTVPPDTFASAFAEGRFRVVWLNPPAVYPVRAEGLPGPAASESPFGIALVPGDSGVATAELPAGVSRWHAAWGRVSVDVRPDGSATWIVVR